LAAHRSSSRSHHRRHARPASAPTRAARFGRPRRAQAPLPGPRRPRRRRRARRADGPGPRNVGAGKRGRAPGASPGVRVDGRTLGRFDAGSPPSVAATVRDRGTRSRPVAAGAEAQVSATENLAAEGWLPRGCVAVGGPLPRRGGTAFRRTRQPKGETARPPWDTSLARDVPASNVVRRFAFRRAPVHRSARTAAPVRRRAGLPRCCGGMPSGRVLRKCRFDDAWPGRTRPVPFLRTM
jgi:hypothetical protein